MQSFPSIIIEGCPDLDMAQKELSDRVEKLTGRVTALEKKRTPNSVSEGKWDRSFVVAVAAFVVAAVGLPIMLASWIEPHLHNDLKNDVKIEVTDQLKEPLKQISEIAGDVKEIKGKLEVLDPLIRELTLKRISDAGNLNSKDLVSRLPELRHLAVIAKTEKITAKPEAVEKVGKKLVDIGTSDAWGAALEFVNYKSFLNIGPAVPGPVVPFTNTPKFTAYQTPPSAGPMYAIGDSKPPDVPQFRPINEPDMNQGKTFGPQFLKIVGGEVQLDGFYIKRVILENVHVIYRGGPTALENVYFINCTFDVSQKPLGQELATRLLERGASISAKLS